MLWQMLPVEWPLQVWRSLGANGGATLSAMRGKITWRKVVFVAALLVAAIAFAQVFSLDVAFFMAGDVAFYCEIAAAVMLVVVKGHIRHSVQTAKLALAHAMPRARIGYWRSTGARHRRNIKGPTASDKGADDEGGWLPEPRRFPAWPCTKPQLQVQNIFARINDTVQIRLINAF
jgi:hypothetical protein